MRTCVRVRDCGWVRVCVCVYIRARMCTCVRVLVHVCVSACVCVGVCVYCR